MDLKSVVKTAEGVLSFDICEDSCWYALGFSKGVKLCSLRDESEWKESKLEDGCSQVSFSKDGTLIAILSQLLNQKRHFHVHPSH